MPSFLPIGSHGPCEVWFRGVHSDVGGGNKPRLSPPTLRWMMHKGKVPGLPILQEDINALQPDPGGCAAPPGPSCRWRFGRCR